MILGYILDLPFVGLTEKKCIQKTLKLVPLKRAFLRRAKIKEKRLYPIFVQ